MLQCCFAAPPRRPAPAHVPRGICVVEVREGMGDGKKPRELTSHVGQAARLSGQTVRALLLTRTASAGTGEPPVPRKQQSDRAVAFPPCSPFAPLLSSKERTTWRTRRHTFPRTRSPMCWKIVIPANWKKAGRRRRCFRLSKNHLRSRLARPPA